MIHWLESVFSFVGWSSPFFDWFLFRRNNIVGVKPELVSLRWLHVWLLAYVFVLLRFLHRKTALRPKWRWIAKERWIVFGPQFFFDPILFVDVPVLCNCYRIPLDVLIIDCTFFVGRTHLIQIFYFYVWNWLYWADGCLIHRHRHRWTCGGWERRSMHDVEWSVLIEVVVHVAFLLGGHPTCRSLEQLGWLSFFLWEPAMRNRSEFDRKPVDCWDVQCVVDVSWALGKQILIKACWLQLVQASLIEAGKLTLAGELASDVSVGQVLTLFTCSEKSQEPWSLAWLAWLALAGPLLSIKRFLNQQKHALQMVRLATNPASSCLPGRRVFEESCCF